MKRKNLCLTILLILMITCLPIWSVHGSNYTWKVSDRYTWETYSGSSSWFENETTTWDHYYFYLAHELGVKILKVHSSEKIVDLEESWAYLGMESPFKIQEVEKSYDFQSTLFFKNFSSLFIPDYEYDDTENETYLANVRNCQTYDRIALRYFCTANWIGINSFFQILFDDTAILNV